MKRIRYIDKIIAYRNYNLISDEEAVEMIHKHEETLEKRRKYKKGQLIESLDEIMEQEFIYIYNTIWHKTRFANLQISWLRHQMKMGHIYKAIKKE